MLHGAAVAEPQRGFMRARRGAGQLESVFGMFFGAHVVVYRRAAVQDSKSQHSAHEHAEHTRTADNI